MTNPSLGSGIPAASTFKIDQRAALQTGAAWLLLAGLLAGAFFLQATAERGSNAALALLLGGALGIAFQRGRFCFFCIFRDLIEQHNSGPIYAVLTALAVGGIGYTIVFGAFLPNPMSGRLAPDAHIGPVSPALVAAGVAFGLGMALSGACISGQLYRLGEGYVLAPFALFGSLIGFGLGFATWNDLYVAVIADAPVPWLPAWIGYGGALAVHLALLAIPAFFLLRFVRELPAQPARQLNANLLGDTVLRARWNPLVTGTIVGILGVVGYLRIEPLGVTSQLGSLTRTAMDGSGLLPERLNGLDTFAGCATVVVQTITDNGWLIGGMVLAAAAAALAGGHFRLSRFSWRGSASALLGGILMGWGSMIALGCTVGTLLSGIMAFAPSGWVFGAAVFGGVWVGVRLRLYRYVAS